MPQSTLAHLTAPFRSAHRLVKRLHRDERGLASAEFVAVMPVFVLLMAGIISFAGMAYYHLALLTTANDCAVMISHEPAQYYGTASQVQGAYGIDADIEGSYEAGGSFAACSAFTEWDLYALRYTVHMPLQPYRSIWP